MAKKKAIEEPVNETGVVGTTEDVVTTENQIETVDEEETLQEEGDKTIAEKEVKEEAQEIPSNIQRILLSFRNMPELYITTSGRVFTPDTKPSLRGNAILYKNPFYNSKL